MGSAFSVGFLIGPVAGGVLASHAVHIGALPIADPLRMPFLVAAALCAINWFYGLLVLPESLRARAAHRPLRVAARQSGRPA